MSILCAKDGTVFSDLVTLFVDQVRMTKITQQDLEKKKKVVL